MVLITSDVVPFSARGWLQRKSGVTTDPTAAPPQQGEASEPPVDCNVSALSSLQDSERSNEDEDAAATDVQQQPLLVEPTKSGVEEPSPPPASPTQDPPVMHLEPVCHLEHQGEPSDDEGEVEYPSPEVVESHRLASCSSSSSSSGEEGSAKNQEDSEQPMAAEPLPATAAPRFPTPTPLPPPRQVSAPVIHSSDGQSLREERYIPVPPPPRQTSAPVTMHNGVAPPPPPPLQQLPAWQMPGRTLVDHTPAQRYGAGPVPLFGGSGRTAALIGAAEGHPHVEQSQDAASVAGISTEHR